MHPHPNPAVIADKLAATAAVLFLGWSWYRTAHRDRTVELKPWTRPAAYVALGLLLTILFSAVWL